MKKHSNKGLRKLCAHPRRAWGKCEHSWYFNFKLPRGAAYRFSLDKHFNRHIDSKDEAQILALNLKKEIREGRFGKQQPIGRMTLGQLIDLYLERYVKPEHPDTVDDFTSGLRVIRTTVLPCPTGGSLPFEQWALDDVVTDTVLRYREARRALGTGTGGTNRSLSRLRAVYNWAIKAGYRDATPFARHGKTVVTLSRETPRSRRLNADIDEEGNLLAACPAHLRAVVECTLETGMRRGEILGLRWSNVEGLTIDEDGKTVRWAPRASIVLTAARTKTKRDRRIPISTRLRGILELRRFDPAGTAHDLDRFVFGTELGEKIDNVKRSWARAVLTAHGVKPKYTATMNLTRECRDVLERIDLHFHDLRREAGSRWLDGGVPLHVIRDWLGHTNISQTSTYLSGTMKTAADAMAAYEKRLQPACNEDGKAGQKKTRKASTRRRKTNKDKGRHEPATVM